MRRPILPLLFAICAVRAAHAQNVLLIVGDDIGVDRVAAYAEHPDPGHTPVLDQLAADGVLFRNCWASPLCTPSRASILTGRLPHRTGVGGGPPDYANPPWLSNDEVTLAEIMPPGYARWALGKWHLDNDEEPFLNPLDQGFDLHWGSTGSLQETLGETYFDWTKSIDGTFSQVTKYATTDTIDDALALIGSASGPWFMYLALNAPHSPVHKPPQALHTYDLPASISGNIPIHVRAMVEAMDTELGRLFDGMGPALLDQTLVIFIGDNGTGQTATDLPFLPEHGKGTIFEGGLNVPLIVRGPGVAQGAECDGLVAATDLFATIADFLGVPHPSATDSVSMLPYLATPDMPSIRPWVYGERFSPDGIGLHPLWERAVRDGRYKLVQRFKQEKQPFTPRFQELYDLLLDPFEQDDIVKHPNMTPEEHASFLALQAAASQFMFPWLDFGQALGGPGGAPKLVGKGSFAPGDPYTIALTGAPASAQLGLVLGFATLDLPFKGGVLVPDFTPPGTIVLVSADPVGSLLLGTSLPPNAPQGLHVFVQCWMQDPAGPLGWTASNAIAGTIQ